jgi:hypothetical protein
VARSFCWSFHQAVVGLTGAHWLDDPPELSCKDSIGQHSVDGPLLSCKQQVGGSSPPASSQHRRSQACSADGARVSAGQLAAATGLSARYARALVAEFQAQLPAALQHNGRRPAAAMIDAWSLTQRPVPAAWWRPSNMPGRPSASSIQRFPK